MAEMGVSESERVKGQRQAGWGWPLMALREALMGAEVEWLVVGAGVCWQK